MLLRDFYFIIEIKMNFVMTGHRGLIGSFLLKRLTERGDKPVLLVDKREGKDIAGINSFKLEEEASVMYHLAAFCKINQSIENPQRVFEDNVSGTHEVLEFCRRNGIGKIVFTSSSRVLSKEKNPYTASKVYGEELVRGYHDCYGIDYSIISPSTVYGPFNDLTGRLVDIFILNALRGEELKIYGDKDKTLDFTYVDDFVNGLLIASEQRNSSFVISSGKSERVSDVADMIIGLAGKGRKAFYHSETAQPQNVNLDISQIGTFGYTPRVFAREGITRTFDWYKNNLDEIMNSRAVQ